MWILSGIAIWLQPDDERNVQAAVGGTAIATALGQLFLVFCGHKIPLCGPDPSARYFLDICVINQTNIELMMMGAYHLAEYVLASQEFIVCWTPQYLTRLWCVMEIATFARRMHLLGDLKSTDVLHPRDVGKIVLLPMWSPPILLVFSFCVLLLSLALSFAYFNIDEDSSSALVYMALCSGTVAVVAAILCIWRYLRHAQAMVHQFQHFSISVADCVSKDDKILVIEHIRAAWRKDDNEMDGCEVFEEFVRHHLARHICEEHATMYAAIRFLFSNSVLVILWQILAFVLVFAQQSLATIRSVSGSFTGFLFDINGVADDFLGLPEPKGAGHQSRSSGKGSGKGPRPLQAHFEGAWVDAAWFDSLCPKNTVGTNGSKAATMRVPPSVASAVNDWAKNLITVRTVIEEEPEKRKEVFHPGEWVWFLRDGMREMGQVHQVFDDGRVEISIEGGTQTYTMEGFSPSHRRRKLAQRSASVASEDAEVAEQSPTRGRLNVSRWRSWRGSKKLVPSGAKLTSCGSCLSTLSEEENRLESMGSRRLSGRPLSKQISCMSIASMLSGEVGAETSMCPAPTDALADDQPSIMAIPTSPCRASMDSNVPPRIPTSPCRVTPSHPSTPPPTLIRINTVDSLPVEQIHSHRPQEGDHQPNDAHDTRTRDTWASQELDYSPIMAHRASFGSELGVESVTCAHTDYRSISTTDSGPAQLASAKLTETTKDDDMKRNQTMTRCASVTSEDVAPSSGVTGSSDSLLGNRGTSVASGSRDRGDTDLLE